MKSLLNWAKSNPISVASILFAIAALVAFWFVPVQGGAAVREKADAWNGKMKEVKRYINNSVEIPSEVKGESKMISPITINEKVITEIRGIYNNINDSYDSLLSETLDRNMMDHQLILPAVFDPKNKNNVDLPFKFKKQYREAFVDLLQPYDPAIGGGPTLNAGLPPFPEEQAQVIKEAQDNYISSIEVSRGTASGSPVLTEDDNEEIIKAQRMSLIELLQNQANSVNVYADAEFNSPMFPFHIGAWAVDVSGIPPKPHELYEGQLELWIQQDIVSAIALANDIYKTDENGLFVRNSDGALISNVNSSVLTSPIKNLKQIEIVSGYVGIQSRGGFDGKYRESKGNSGGMTGGRKAIIAYSPPAEMIDDINAKVGENFYLSPTGRGSNPIYDVRHVRLVADVDYEQLPKIFEALNKVNFMTVVDCRISQVDEYELLSQGYMYGKADCVTVDLMIESIWLRQDLQKYMPDMTLEYLGLKEPSNPDAAGMMNMMGGDMFF
ncbi:hypothetical protein JD969_18540 [Planctomycetota bacterium]|nr:hypothetical protein JD969_18540 [Planctomycetota bacterium]